MTALPGSPSLDANPNCSDWIDLSRDGVVVVKSGKVEIGQGIATALVQIAADELDVAPGRCALVSGHTALGPTEAGTSSSLSIEVSGRAIRLASSAVRQLLLAEAATLLQASPDRLSVTDGGVHVDGRATDLTLWSLARRVGLDQPVMMHANPKKASERRLAGQPMPRLDLGAKITGPAFLHDLDLEGMLHARVLQPPAAARTLEAFDPIPVQSRFPDVTIIRDGSFVAFLAEQEYDAIAAAKFAALRTRWSRGKSVPATLRDAIGVDSAKPEIVIETGNVAAMSGRRISIEIERPYIAHASLAPSCAIATWQGDKLEVYSHSQGVHDLRAGLAIAFATPAENITVMHAPGAGTYGHSGQDDPPFEAALLAKAVPGRPVRVAWQRAEDFALAPMGPGTVVEATATVGSDGRIVALDVLSTGQGHVHRPGRGGTANFVAGTRLATALATSPTGDVPLARGGGMDRNAQPLYAIPNVRVSKRILADLPYRTSALRGLGAYANVLAVESLMDDIAHELGVDAVKLRLDHLDDARARAVIERCAAMAAWPGKTGEGEGLGLAFAQYKNRSGYCAVAVRVVIDESVRVTHAWSAVDVGEAINPDGVANQIEGGIIQSASWTLKEAVTFDGDAVTSVEWEGYPVLKFSEVPEIAVEVIERPEEKALGVGEASTGPTAAAISNAVRNALGVRVTRLPITRDAIITALG